MIADPTHRGGSLLVRSTRAGYYLQMLSLTETQASALDEICQRLGVTRLDLFGSATTGRFDPTRSDLDFLVEFGKAPPMNLADQYFGLLEALEELFQRKVDLLTARSLRNPYLIREIEKTRRPLYAA